MTMTAMQTTLEQTLESADAALLLADQIEQRVIAAGDAERPWRRN